MTAKAPICPCCGQPIRITSELTIAKAKRDKERMKHLLEEEFISSDVGYAARKIGFHFSYGIGALGRWQKAGLVEQHGRRDRGKRKILLWRFKPDLPPTQE